MKVQKAKVGTGDLSHAEAIFGRVSKADLRHVDVINEKFGSGTRADEFIPLNQNMNTKKSVVSQYNTTPKSAIPVEV